MFSFLPELKSLGVDGNQMIAILKGSSGLPQSPGPQDPSGTPGARGGSADGVGGCERTLHLMPPFLLGRKSARTGTRGKDALSPSGCGNLPSRFLQFWKKGKYSPPALV